MFCDTALLVVQNNEVRYFFCPLCCGSIKPDFLGDAVVTTRTQLAPTTFFPTVHIFSGVRGFDF